MVILLLCKRLEIRLKRNRVTNIQFRKVVQPFQGFMYSIVLVPVCKSKMVVNSEENETGFAALSIAGPSEWNLPFWEPKFGVLRGGKLFLKETRRVRIFKCI